MPEIEEKIEQLETEAAAVNEEAFPETGESFDTIEITEDDILNAQELESEPDEEATVEEAADVIPEPETEEAEDVSEEIEEPDDAIVEALNEIRGRLDGLVEMIAQQEGRVTALESREAARNKKLTGFFAPIPDGKDPDVGQLPKIEKKYIF